MSRHVEKGKKVLLSGEEVPEFEGIIELETIRTHCPAKWAFVDLESGNIYGWDFDNRRWCSPPPKAAAAIRKTLDKMREGR